MQTELPSGSDMQVMQPILWKQNHIVAYNFQMKRKDNLP